MALCLIFIPDSSGAVSVSFTTVLGIYLGLDIAGMIAKTASLPKGEYKALNIYKYVITSLSLFILIIISLIVKDRSDVRTALTSYISAIMIIIACLLGGLEGNNIATDNEGKQNER